MTDLRIQPWVASAPGLDSGSKWTLAALWSFANWESDGPAIVWPTVATVAERTGDPERTVQHRLAKLRGLGWIRRTRAQGHDAWELAWRNPWPSDSNPLRAEAQPIAPATDCALDRNPLREGVQPIAVYGRNPLHPEQTENKQEPDMNGGDARAPDPRPARWAMAEDELPDQPSPRDWDGFDEAARSIATTGTVATASTPAAPPPLALGRTIAEVKTSDPRARLPTDVLDVLRTDALASMMAGNWRWHEWLLECIADEGLDGPAVEKLLAARKQPGGPNLRDMWSFAYREWRRAALGRAPPPTRGRKPKNPLIVDKCKPEDWTET